MAKGPAGVGDKVTLDPDLLTSKMQELTAFIGEQVKAARLRLNLSQAQVAGRAETSSNQIFLIESGKQNMTIKSLVSLALILEVEPAQFFPSPQTASERPDTKHVLTSIEDGCSRAKAELERIEGLMQTLKSLDTRRSLP